MLRLSYSMVLIRYGLHGKSTRKEARSMRKLTIFGATGSTGTNLVQQAIGAGSEVTAVVRDPGRLALPAQPLLRVVQADVMDPAAILSSLAGADAVLTAIG